MRSANIDRRGKVGLTLRDQGHELHIRIREGEGYAGRVGAAGEAYVDAQVRVRGVLVADIGSSGAVTGWKMFTASPADISLVHPAVPERELPLLSVRAAFTAHPPPHRIRLRGSVVREGANLVLKDATGSALLRARESRPIRTGGDVEIAGFVSNGAGAATLEESENTGSERTARPLPVLTTAGRVHELPEREAALGYPVRLHAVVTFYNPTGLNLVVQDETGGVYVSGYPRDGPQLRAGQFVELEGVTAPGDFAAVIKTPRARVLGERALPEPLRVNVERLLAGAVDSIWVEASGLVYLIGFWNGCGRLGLRVGSRRWR